MITIDDLEDRGEAALLDAVRQGVSEGLQLDFKTSHPRNPLFDSESGLLTRKGREVLAAALSAFANSAGGMIVLGVECKQVEGIDVAASLIPLGDFARASSSVSGLAAQLVLPRVEGLKVVPIASSQGGNRGYLAIHVPRSERRPHMSQADRHYYKRSGSSSFQMEHYDIEDAYRRQATPILGLRWEFRSGMTEVGRKINVEVDLFVENSGRSTAKFVTVSLSGRRGLKAQVWAMYGAGPNRIERIGDEIVISAPGDFVVNPNSTRKVDKMHFELVRRGDTVLIDGVPWRQATFSSNYSLGAENTWPQTGTMTWVPDDYAAIAAQLDRHSG